MRNKKALSIAVRIITVAALYVLFLLFLYFNSLPESYDLEIGMTSTVDITTQQDVEDTVLTQQRAQEAANRVTQVMTRSEAISEQILSRLDQFFLLTDTVREQLFGEARALQEGVETDPTDNDGPDGEEENEAEATPTPVPGSQPVVLSETAIQAAATRLIEDVEAEQGVILTEADAQLLVSLESTIYSSISFQTKRIASTIMALSIDNAGLSAEIDRRVSVLVNSVEFFRNEYELAGRILRIYLRPNLVYDEAATEAARNAEYDRAMSNPDVVPAGTRILNVGDTVTAEVYGQLQQLDLIEDDSIDWRLMSGLALLTAILLAFGIVYLNYYERQYKVTEMGDRVVLIASLLIPFLVSGYITGVHPLAAPIYFASILISSYYGLRTGIIMTLLLIVAVLPMTFLNITFLFTALVGGVLACYLAAAYRKRDSQVWMIVFTALGSGLTALTFGMIGSGNWTQISSSVIIVMVTAGLSSIGAIGIMPIFETAISSVSPITLISLSQPSQPLLRRLFLEASGTYQHSMMVANLSEAAAEAIGADGMLCRVGCYYHDIGKLENPEMFTENQDGFNIHDTMEPEDSVRYIIGHVSAGLKTAKRYRLPLPIQKIITEHHGNTLQASFYYAAKKKAEEEGLPLPNADDYRYPWHVPSSKESGVVMLADSMEAAMKSTRTNNLKDTETLARKIAKGKIEQDQLVESGLSFKDVEAIIQSFVQVYQGQFHERVRYPDASTSSESAEEVREGGRVVDRADAEEGAGKRVDQE